ncbi:MAG: phytanoyl-CoA dioxygenase family protein [Ilumatobacteraceae bacterium]
MATDLHAFERDGYVVLERAVGEDTIERVRSELSPWLGDDAHKGRNDFEGFKSNRVYALLAKAPAIATLVEHPWVMAMLDQLLLPEFLLSANLAINLLPGETAQQFHIDDDFYRVARPRRPIGVSAIWAIDEFTAENGATEVIPGSHLWGEEVPRPDHPDVVEVAMPAGSVVVFAGTLWHRGGANRSDRPRLAITPQYCEPWARQQEQQILAVGDKAADYSKRVQSMLGYSIHPPFMGHVNGLHPLRLLDPAYDPAGAGAGKAAAAYWADEPEG